MNVNVNALVLATGIAIGAATSSWLQPSPARAAEPVPAVAYEYKYENQLLAWDRDANLNRLAAEGWEPISFYWAGGTPTIVLRRLKGASPATK